MKNMKKMQLALATGSVLAAGSSFADVPASVTTAITTAGTDAATLGAAVLVVLVGIYAFKLLRKSL